jgi:hypothetical protein
MTPDRWPYYHRRSLDPQLRPFLDAKDDATAALALEELLGGPLAGVIADAVGRELGGSHHGSSHIEDVVSDVRLRLIRKLSSLRPAREAGDEAIANLAGYATVTAERACYAFLRRQFPERTRFRNRVRYVLARLPQVRFEAGADGVWRAVSSAVRSAPKAGAAEQFMEDPARWLHAGRVDTAQPLPALVAAVLGGLDRPIELDRLVNALASVLGIADVTRGAGADDRPSQGDTRREPVDPSPLMGDVLEQREDLLRVWREIIELPLRQRVALLLNLRDPEGGAVLQMLPATGVVTAGQVADALEMTPAALDQLWARLPLDDLSIASQLGLTRQQVINLRKSARARLARRLSEKRS